MNSLELMAVFGCALSNVNDVVIIRDEFGNIIYSNKTNIDYKKLSLLSTSKKEVEMDGEIYSVNSISFYVNKKNYDIEIYQNKTIVRKLENENNIDYLTELVNRRGIELGIECMLADFQSIPFSVIMGDIDDFKKVNDTLGHANGDYVLKLISSLLKDGIRNMDLIGRYGGEEFLMLLRACNLEQSYQVIEKIRHKIECISYPYKQIKKITMSFGISLYDDGCDIKDVIKEADQALYESKKNGKNQTTIYSEKILKKSK